MKVALLTIWHEKNYGAELQTYATIKTLTERGHDVKVIDYRLHYCKVKSLKSRFLNSFEALMPANKGFESFWKKYIPSTRLYTSIEDLTNNPPIADCYMVGSDQVWNPEITKEKALVYFLSFAPQGIKRVSYASSVGSNVWSNCSELSSKVKNLLLQFDALSCREETGAKLLNSEFGILPTVVLDPTLLRGNFNELIGTYKQRNTLAFYQLFGSKEFENCAKSIAEQMNLTFININQSKKILGKIQFSRTSIIDWVKGIAESKFVVTHSFHGLALSLLYHKQFVIIYNSKNKRSSRITDLLSKLGLADRFFDNLEDALISKVWQKKIDFELVDQRLDMLRKQSINYLSEAGL